MIIPLRTLQIRRMDLEARNLPASEGQSFLRKLKDFKSELDKMKKEMKKAEASSREELFDLEDSVRGNELAIRMTRRLINWRKKLIRIA